MSRALLTTRLKVVDPTAVTALETLRRRFEFGERLAALSREELFLFDVDAPAPATRAQIEGLVRGTNLLMNPNKHAWRLVVESEEGTPPPGDAGEAFLVVWTPGGGDELLAAIQRHALAPDVAALARGWIWRFEAGHGVDAEALQAIVEQSGELRSRSRGFLVHPAYQEHRVYARRPTLYDIGAVISFESTFRASGEKS